MSSTLVNISFIRILGIIMSMHGVSSVSVTFCLSSSQELCSAVAVLVAYIIQIEEIYLISNHQELRNVPFQPLVVTFTLCVGYDGYIHSQ